MRYFYKTNDETKYISLKSPSDNNDYIAITEQEWNNHISAQISSPSNKKMIKYQINIKKSELLRTDYVVIKIAEAETEEEKNQLRSEYANVIARRKQLRTEINELEGQL